MRCKFASEARTKRSLKIRREPDGRAGQKIESIEVLVETKDVFQIEAFRHGNVALNSSPCSSRLISYRHANGSEKPTAHASRSLKAAKKNYLQVD